MLAMVALIAGLGTKLIGHTLYGVPPYDYIVHETLGESVLEEYTDTDRSI